ncbi:DUF1579 domain-containing protein [Sphingomonas panacisoli]|uniref:DUF1579 domain-containing protein n=1 Tax=Sphingomonas panacisoli TaxID=1813879 RepID=A0A5B8LP52_9SPHN|nr:DUF1579 domain-containing protein [Sphingomonas panacisoli]QDZ08890.1 DUF1579 domain-containing protein [Sphingomonas panacisoli]
MRKVLIAGLSLALIASVPGSAQVADTAALSAQKVALDKFAWMDGTWRGPAVKKGPGGEHRVTQTERIGPMLGGTLRVIEGKGFNPDGSVGFNAFAVISWDAQKQAYDFRSYAQGRAGDFMIRPTADGYVWEIPAGPMIIRYTATLKDETWTEIGERIAPGQPAVPFFEMHLKRVGDTAWPNGGAMTPN